MNKLCQNCRFREQVEIQHSPGCRETRLYCQKRMKEYGFKTIKDTPKNREQECRVGSHDWCRQWKEFVA